MKSPLRSLQTRRKFARGSQRRPVRSPLGRPGGPLSLRRSARQSQRMNSRRAGFRGL
jgi:hypothetical protein